MHRAKPEKFFRKPFTSKNQKVICNALADGLSLELSVFLRALLPDPEIHPFLPSGLFALAALFGDKSSPEFALLWSPWLLSYASRYRH